MESICYCKICINLGSKGIISILSSNPIKRISDHIEIHCRQLLFDDHSSKDNGVAFVVKKCMDQNNLIFTIEKEIKSGIVKKKEIKKENDQQSTNNISRTIICEEDQSAKKRKSQRSIRKKDPILNHCRTILVDKINENGQAYCAKCNKHIKVATGTGSKKSIEFSKLISHAQIHSTNFWFKCDQCDYKGKSRKNMSNHLREKHKIRIGVNDFQNIIADHANEIIDLITDCFDQTQAEVESRIGKRTDSIGDQCRKILGEKINESGRAYCFVCEKNVKAKTVANCINVRDIVKHVQAHLTTFMYNCDRCQFRSKTEDGLWSHFRRFHKIQQKNKRNKDRLISHKNQIIDMLLRCFDPTQIREQNSEMQSDKTVEPRKIKIDRLARLRRSHCNNLVSKFQSDGKIQCRLCEETILHRKRLAVYSFCSHVLSSHLNLLPFTCRRCSKSFKTYGAIMAHLRKKHGGISTNGEYENRMNDYHEEIITKLSECFDLDFQIKENKEEEKEILKGQGYIWISNHVRKLFKNRPTSMDRVKCLECGKCLSLITRKGNFFVENIIQHVTAHLKNPLFTCQLCDHKNYTNVSMRQHLFVNHNLRGNAHYSDSTHIYKDEIIKMIGQCFNQTVNSDREQTAGIKINLKNKPGVSVQFATRQMYCHQLLKANGNKKNISCRLCSKVLSLNYSMSRALLDHVERDHLEKPLYRCRLCPKTCKYRTGIGNHMKIKKRIKNKEKNRFDDLSDDHHEEIMDLLKKCFKKRTTQILFDQETSSINRNKRGKTFNITPVLRKEKTRVLLWKKFLKKVKRARFASIVQHGNQCQFCKFNTTNINLLKMHMKIVHEKY